MEEIEKLIQQLSVHDRALLTRHLIQNLDEEESEMDEHEIEQLWIAEAERRSVAIKNGTAKLRSADEVMRIARSR